MKYERISRAISQMLLVSLLSVSFHPLAFAEAMRPSVVQAVRVVQDDDALLAIIELDGMAVYTQSTLPQPPRLIVDIKNAVQTIRPLSR